MPASFLSGLPKSARAAFPIIRRGVAEGLSSRVIEQRVRQAGLKISRTRSILPIQRALKKLEAQGRNVRFVSGSNVINAKRLPPALNALTTQYRYRVRVAGIENGVFGQRGFLSVSTDDGFLTPDMIKDQALGIMKENPKKYPLDGIELDIEFGEQRAGIGDFTEMRGGNFLIGGGAALTTRGLAGTVLNTTV